MKKNVMSNFKKKSRLAFLLGLSLGISPSLLRASVDPSLTQTNKEALIQNILTDLRNSNGPVWSVFLNHGHGNHGELSQESVKFLKEYQDTLTNQNKLLIERENSIAPCQTGVLQEKKIQQLKKRRTHIQTQIENEQGNCERLCKNYQSFYNKIFETLPLSVFDFDPLLMQTLDRSPFEENTNSFTFIIPEAASQILNGEWIARSLIDSKRTSSNIPGFFKSLVDQTLSIFSQEFSSDLFSAQDTFVTSYDPNNLWFTIHCSKPFLYINQTSVNKPNSAGLADCYTTVLRSNDFLVHGCIDYNNFLIKSCNPLFDASASSSEIPEQTVTLANPVPLSQFFSELRQKHPEISYPTEKDFLNQFSKQFAQQLTRRFLFSYLNFELFTKCPGILYGFNVFYDQKLPLPEKEAAQKQLSEALKSFLKTRSSNFSADIHLPFDICLALGYLLTFSQLPPPIRSVQEHEALQNYLQKHSDGTSFKEFSLVSENFSTQDVAKYNREAQNKRTQFKETKKKLEDLKKRLADVESQLVSTSEQQSSESHLKTVDLDHTIAENNQYLTKNQEQAQTFFQQAKNIGKGTRQHFLGKLRKKITHALTNLLPLFSSITEEEDEDTDEADTTLKLKKAHIAVTYPTSNPSVFLSILELQINQPFFISETSNFSLDFSLQKTDKLTVIAIHNRDGKVLHYSTAYPSPGTEIFKLDQQQDGFSVPKLPSLQPLPIQPLSAGKVQKSVENLFANLDPEKLALLEEMEKECQETQSKKGKKKGKR